MSKLIVLIGKAGSGKSTVAKQLKKELGGVIVSFAEPIRDMLRGLGLTDQHLIGDLKEIRCELLSGYTPRYVMQTLGTDWARTLLDENFWVNIWKHKVKNYLNNNHIVITDDCRFLNEERAVLEMDGMIFRLRRDVRDIETAQHKSEQEIGLIKEHYVIDNNRSCAEVTSDIICGLED